VGLNSLQSVNLTNVHPNNNNKNNKKKKNNNKVKSKPLELRSRVKSLKLNIYQKHIFLRSIIAYFRVKCDTVNGLKGDTDASILDGVKIVQI
jgi:hypothetical protein